MSSLTRRELLAQSLSVMFAGAVGTVGGWPARGMAAESSEPMLDFARSEVISAARATALTAPRIDFLFDQSLGEQAYRIEKNGSAFSITAGDAAGAMYGGLGIAEAMRLGSDAMARLLAAGICRPHVVQRGIKFDIPLDLRTPGYCDGSTSARDNIPDIWTREFWSEYFDELARHRYNAISLWNLHPFPSMVKVPEFPDVALDDVWRGTRPLDTIPLQHSGRSAVSPEGLAQHQVVKKISIDEKIAFWRDVMQMAANRGIRVYIVTWNVFTWGAQGKYGIDNRMVNPITRAYLRASVRSLLETYPLLSGIGLTAGENMKPQPGVSKEPWLWSTYGEGVRDALAKQPDRDFKLIHRFWQTSGEEIRKNWAKPPLWPDKFQFSFKYSWAHMYSDTKPHFVDSVMPLLNDTGLKTWVEVRNDDLYALRWGDPAFAREYVKNLPSGHEMVGFFMGPDGFIWGRDYLDRETAGQDLGPARRLIIQKHWYSFMLWGRLAYDPELADIHFVESFQARYPGADAEQLYKATAVASKIIPQTSRFFWRDEDLNWLPEACAGWDDSCGSELWNVAGFVTGVTMPNSGILNIRQWRHRELRGLQMDAMTPRQVADELARLADETLRIVAKLRARPSNLASKDLREIVGDNEAMAHLGTYYAEKIQGACDLALFDATAAEKHRTKALAHLDKALAAWKRYAAVRDAQYLPNYYARIGWIDITAMTAAVAADLDIVRRWQPGIVSYDPDDARDRQIGDSTRIVS